jgi:hypothetical protein
VPADVLAAALFASFRSRREHTFGEQMLSAMRMGFGGHVEGQESSDPKPASNPEWAPHPVGGPLQAKPDSVV